MTLMEQIEAAKADFTLTHSSKIADAVVYVKKPKIKTPAEAIAFAQLVFTTEGELGQINLDIVGPGFKKAFDILARSVHRT